MKDASAIVKNLLQNGLELSFGKVDCYAIERETVIAAMYDPVSKKFLYQYWKNYHGLTCLLSGGVEENEAPLKAIKREIVEETGLLDFRVVGVLGGKIHNYYRKAATNQSFVKHITAYLVRLDSYEHIATQRESDEEFENLYGTAKEILSKMESYEQSSGSMLDDHKEILRRAVAIVEQKSNIN